MKNITRLRTICHGNIMLANIMLFATGCGPFSLIKKTSPEQWSASLAQGRRVGVESLPGDFEAFGHQGVSPGSQHLVDTKASSTRLVSRSPQSGLGVWVLIDPETSEPVGVSELHRVLLQEISNYPDIYGIDLTALGKEPTLVKLSDDLVGVSLSRSFHEIPVRDSYVQGIFWRDGSGMFRLREVVNQSYGPLVLTNGLAQGSTWDDLRQALPTDEGRGDLVPVKLRRVVLPHDLLKGSGQSGNVGNSVKNSVKNSLEYSLEYSLATEFTYQWSDREATYTVTLQDGSGQILESYSSEYRAALPIQASVYKRGYLDAAQVGKSLMTTPFLVQGATVNSDIDGIVDLGNATTVQVRLQSQRGVILPRQGNAVVQVPATPVLVEGNLQITTTGENLVAMNTYTNVLEVNQFMRRHLADTDSSYLNAPTTVRVSVRGSCNAFYDSQLSSISLFAAGNGCANVALINDVFYHEWGHGLDNFTGVNVGITDGAFSEAIGDIVAAYLTGSPVTAPGFLLNDATGIRNLDNQKKYPGSLQNQVHADGEIVGGAFWRMRQGMISRYGAKSGAAKAEYLFARHLLSTDSYLQSYQSVLRLDDVDGNPMTKSPNHCLINKTFAFHGLATDENCEDDATPFPVPIDNTAAIAVYRTTEQGVLLMASTEKGKKVSLCLGTKEICVAQPQTHIDLLPEGALDQKTIFLTKDPLTSLKPLTTVTLIVKGPDDKPIGIRSFKLSLK